MQNSHDNSAGNGRKNPETAAADKRGKKRLPKMSGIRKIPGIFRKAYTGKKLEKKVLSRLFVPKDREYVGSLFVSAGEDLYAVPADRMFSADEIKRLKTLASQMKSQKGRVRVIPLVIAAAAVVLVVWAVAAFKNTAVKSVLQKAGEAVFRAKCDIRSVDLRIFDSSLTVTGFAAADRNAPMKNLFEIEKTVIDFDLNELLKGRFVMDEIQVSGIAAGTDRTVSGALPEKKKEEEKPSSGNPEFSRQMETLLAELKKRSGAGIEAVLAQYNPEAIVTSLYGELQSPALAGSLETELKTLVAEWENKADETTEIVESLASSVRRALEIRSSSVSSPEELKKAVEDVSAVIENVRNTTVFVQDTAKRIETDAAAVQRMVGDVDRAIQHDISFASEQVKKMASFTVSDAQRLVSQSFDTMAFAVLGEWYPKICEVLEAVEKFQQSGKSGAVKTKEKKAPVSRLPGRDLVYSADNVPTFLIRRLESGGSDAKLGFALKGAVTNISNDADKLGKPVQADIQLIRQNMTETVRAVFDFRSANAGTTVAADFLGTGYAVNLALPAEAGLPGLPKVAGTAAVSASFGFGRDESAELSGTVRLSPMTVRVEAFEPAFVYDLYRRAVTPIDGIEASGNFAYDRQSGVSLDISSDIDRKLADNLKNIIAEESAAIRKKLEAAVDEQVAAVRSRFESELEAFNSIRSQIDDGLVQVQSFMDSLEEKQDEIRRQIEDAARKAANEAADRALNEAVNKAAENLPDSISGSLDADKLKEGLKKLF